VFTFIAEGIQRKPGLIVNYSKVLIEAQLRLFPIGKLKSKCSYLETSRVLNSLKYDCKRILIRMNNYIIILIRMKNYIKNTNEDDFYQI
jgi:hypothetical protein